MSNARKEYVPPVAELIQLQPSEAIAVWDWKYGYTWRNPGYNPGADGLASAIVVTGGFGFTGDEDWAEDGFVIKRNS